MPWQGLRDSLYSEETQRNPGPIPHCGAVSGAFCSGVGREACRTIRGCCGCQGEESGLGVPSGWVLTTVCLERFVAVYCNKQTWSKRAGSRRSLLMRMFKSISTKRTFAGEIPRPATQGQLGGHCCSSFDFVKGILPAYCGSSCTT